MNVPLSERPLPSPVQVDLINRFRKNIGLKPIIWMHQGSQIMNILQASAPPPPDAPRVRNA